MRAATGLYLPANVLHSDKNRRYNRRPGQGEPLLSEAELGGACAVLAQQILEAARGGRLLTNPRFDYILARWMDVALDAAKQWVQETAATDDGLTAILNALVRREPDSRTNGWLYSFDVETLRSLFEMPSLESRAMELRGHGVTGHTLDALDRTLEQLHQAAPEHDAG